jgi:hypothetical protein
VVTPPKGAETGLVLPETGGEPVQAQVANAAGFQQEMALMKAQMKADMEARIQQLEASFRQSLSEIEKKR